MLGGAGEWSAIVKLSTREALMLATYIDQAMELAVCKIIEGEEK